jgi:hypothetical protein
MRRISRRQLIAGAAVAAIAVSAKAWAKDLESNGDSMASPIGGEATTDNTVSLAGQWRFRSNGPRPGFVQGNVPDLAFAETINLPGTTDTNRVGPPSDERDADSLTQPYRIVGPCWYERDFEIPPAWSGKRITLLFERTRYTQVWLDGKPIGENAILCTPQIYELGAALNSGVHRLTMVIDNSRLPVNADAHMWSGNTQGNWNGIVGKIELTATDPVWMDDIQAYPDVENRSVLLKVRIRNITGVPGEGTVVVRAESPGIPSPVIVTVESRWQSDTVDVEIPVALGSKAELWDEFNPARHRLTVHLSGGGMSDVRVISFGLRDFKAKNKQFAINRRTTFLRGKHDACVFPLTGFAPMDTESWINYFKILRSYGLNHVRFHTWTPPEAAFDAADRMGFYLQPELPFWGTWTDQVRAAMEPEAKCILSSLGNHPSFVMFSMGNEPWGGQNIINELLIDLHQLDGRHLYLHGTGDQHPISGDDYTTAGDVSLDWNHPLKSVRGSNGGAVRAPGHVGHVQTGPANTMTDYSDAISVMPGPVISHEMGQYTVYPDFSQITKYTGTNKPYNLERYRQILTDAGMADQADSFSHSTGALSALCYREEIESCLRTPKHGGFELLDLVDYPGQGTALVGMLDAFMDSKGIITPGRWREFCSETVLLAKFRKYGWSTDDTFAADIDLAHYGPKDLPASPLKWSLVTASGHKVDGGILPAPARPFGPGVSSIGSLSVRLSAVKAPAQLRLEIELANSTVKTSYPLWVYSEKVDTSPASGVTPARTLDNAACSALAAGEKVVLICDGSRPLARSVGGAFAPDFWNYRFFINKPGTMALLINSLDGALANFPTETHANWQWFGISFNSQPLILDGTFPQGSTPSVQVVDNYERCHKLGLIFEAIVGPGRILACTSDLIALSGTDLAARQLLASLLSYAGSDRFSPQTSIPLDTLTALLRTTIPTDACKASASSTGQDWRGCGASQVIDGNEGRGWRANDDAQGDSWCKVEFPAPVDLGGLEVLWEQNKPGYKYLVEGSTDDIKWQELSDQTDNKFATARQDLVINANGIRFVRLTISGTPDGRPPVVMELRFFPQTS